MWPFTRKHRRPTASNDSPHTILGRVKTLLKANIHAALDEAEDPEKMLDQLVRNYTAGIADARNAVQETISGVRLIEAQQDKDEKAVEEWSAKAELAAKRAKQAQKHGDQAGSAKAEKLAMTALKKQMAAQQRVESRVESLVAQNDMIEGLKDGLVAMDDRLDELKNNRAELLARVRLAETQETVADAVGQINAGDPTSAMAQLEDKVMRTEARAQGKLEVAGSSMESRFDALESDIAHAEAAERLDALMGRDAPKEVEG